MVGRENTGTSQLCSQEICTKNTCSEIKKNMFVVLSQRLLESDLYHEDLQEHLNNFCYFVSEID